PAPAHYVAPLDLWLYPFPHDPALPALPTVLDAAALTQALQAALPACQTGAMELVRSRAIPLRYRPGKRCTLQLDLYLRHRTTGRFCTQRLYGKLYHNTEKAAAVYDEMHLLTDAVAAKGGILSLATAVAFLPTLNLVLQAPVAGQPLDLQVNRAFAANEPEPKHVAPAVARAAYALAELHQLAVATDRLRPVATDLTKLSRRAAKLAAVAPRLGEAMGALAQRLCDQASQLAAWGAELCVGHGDCKPSQFLLDTTQVALLDFDHCGMADPAADVGLFLATLRQTQVRQQTKSAVRRTGNLASSTWLEAHFLHTYAAGRGAPAAFGQRARWYEALALLRKAWRGFARSPWSPLPALLVEEAWRCLDDVDRESFNWK
ncbi:MAG: phosphotransferase, partial [Caldilineaceae bacterium]